MTYVIPLLQIEPNTSSKLKVPSTWYTLELVWCDINDLPYDMITYEKEAINNNINNIKFSITKADENEKIKIKS